MPRLPKLNRMYIAPARNFNAGGTERVISQALQLGSQITGQINNIQDSTKMQSSISEANNSFNKTLDENKIKYGNDPAEFQKQMNDYKNTLIEDVKKNSKVSFVNKRQFNDIVNRNFIEFDNQIANTNRQLQASKINSDMVSSINASNNTSYIHGKNNDFDLFMNDLSRELAGIETTGKAIYSVDKLNATLLKTKEDSAINYLDGKLFNTSTVEELENFKNELNSDMYDNLLDKKTIDSYLAKVDKIQNQVESTQGRVSRTGGKQVYNPLLTQLINDIDYKFDLAKQSTKDITKNIDNEGAIFLNSIQNKINEARNAGLNDKEYNKYQDNIRSSYFKISQDVLYNKENETVEEGGWFSESNVLYDITKTINDYTSEFSPIDRVDLLAHAMSIMTENGIQINSSDLKDKEKSKKLMDLVIDEYYNLDVNSSNKFDIIKGKIREKNIAEKNRIDNDVIRNIMNRNIDNIQFTETKIN